jgi:hypothetical protein
MSLYSTIKQSFIPKIKEGISNYISGTDIFQNAIKSVYAGDNYIHMPRIYDGEDSPLEQGAAIETAYDYHAIRKRAHEQFLKNPNVRNLTLKYKLWLVGTGLQLQMNPNEKVLEKRGIKIPVGWSDYIDVYFKTWANSQYVSLNEQKNLHGLADDVQDNTFIAGDVLNICYYTKKDGVRIELVDGGNVKTPPWLTDNKSIIDGIHFDKSNKMIAFYVEKEKNEFVKINAKNLNGQDQAWMIFGQTGKLSSVRGLSSLVGSIDYIKMLDELARSLVKGAKENSNVIMSIEHGVNSSGDNPLKPSTINLKKVDVNTIKGDTPEQIQRKVSSISEGIVVNMGPDQKLMRNKNEASGSDSTVFHANLLDSFYTNNGMAPEIAKDQFGGSYSSSRAVGKTFEHKFVVMRTKVIIEQFYFKNFRFWFEMMVASGEIEAPKYFELDMIGKLSYLENSFRGVDMPHIDPLKEAKGIREMLGKVYENVPLIDYAKAVDKASSSDSTKIINNSEKDLQNIKVFNTFVNDSKPKTENTTNQKI